MSAMDECQEKNKKEIGLMKGELGRRRIKEFVSLRAKTYSCLIDDGRELKKQQQRNNKMCSKNKAYASGLQKCVLNYRIILKPRQRFKSEAHNIYTKYQKDGISQQC